MMMVIDETPRAATAEPGEVISHCDLVLPMWAVISTRGVELTGVIFRQACEMVTELDRRSVQGLAIVTADVAGRVKNCGPSPPE